MESNPNISIIPKDKYSPGIKRVGIYSRVSTSRASQLRSLAAQVSELTQYVYQHSDMNLRDIYIDVGSAKTGSTRYQFSRLLQDCKNKKITYVVVKNTSRFGRDTLESLESMRMLQEIGVPVYFFLERIEITKDTAELEQTIRAAIMQSENDSRRDNINLGLETKAVLGTNGLYRKKCYGYVKDEEGNLVPDLHQSAVVKHIFKLYLEGKSQAEIIEDLAEKEILTSHGKARWSKKAIETILTNEKYTGNVIILKSDPYKDSYLARNSHDAIITQEQFDEVQRELYRRAKRKRKY